MPNTDQCFHSFKQSIDSDGLPITFGNPYTETPHALAIQAAKELQEVIETINWDHDFGLETQSEGQTIGKMFGVLVVKSKDGDLGYLAAFSGKIGNQHIFPGFVPPVWDGILDGGVLDQGMKELDRLNAQIAEYGSSQDDEKQALQQKRTDHSNGLQDQIYDGYQFLNKWGKKKSLKNVFLDSLHKNPPGGAGDCAAPKLLQYAFNNELTPLAMAEFWWGYSSNSPQWQHGNFYTPCEHKCRPILRYMLTGLVSMEIDSL